MVTPNVVCSWVCLYRLFSTTLGTASRFNVTTIRVPMRSEDSSLMSAIPVTRPSRARSAMVSTRLSGFTWYGSSLTTRIGRPRESSSAVTTARIRIEPRPVR
jgi:hypothetical protein